PVTSVNASTNRDKTTYSRHAPHNSRYTVHGYMVAPYHFDELQFCVSILFTTPEKFITFYKNSPHSKLTTATKFTTLKNTKVLNFTTLVAMQD
ncbi:hypothetical protein DOY81_006488, partial [Sarcophaga bullata]